MKIILMFLNITFLLLNTSMAQNKKPCSAPEASQFDFWVGEWNASWKDTTQSSGMASGTNNISKILGGCVVYEQFDSTPASPLIGKSVSVYNARTKKWHQTWVDNSGAYLDFSGQWEGDKMVLSRSVEVKGKTIMQRMVWYNITKEKFDWNWEGSKDGGETWQVNWQIMYKRK
ncbi:MAG: hypothetical protein D8M58_13580 [Calditrichaeota bacterium]|nr:MAG: hypothetical protein DWQ03_00545 [Calditrichota bacterium]MBL1206430.1 hypothetical protein [Calditrichota bacterium]NOG46256.1 hypothetical protein [Calditrichota bacterium]